MIAVKYLVENFRDKNPLTKKGSCFISNNTGSTPLHFAAQVGHTEIVKYIMDNIEDKCPKDHYGQTPLHYAASSHGNLDAFIYIIENVPEKSPRDNYGKTPLDLARERNLFGIVKYMATNYPGVL